MGIGEEERTEVTPALSASIALAIRCRVACTDALLSVAKIRSVEARARASALGITRTFVALRLRRGARRWTELRKDARGARVGVEFAWLTFTRGRRRPTLRGGSLGSVSRRRSIRYRSCSSAHLLDVSTAGRSADVFEWVGRYSEGRGARDVACCAKVALALGGAAPTDSERRTLVPRTLLFGFVGRRVRSMSPRRRRGRRWCPAYVR